MDCDKCPLYAECNSARRVAIISLGEGTDGNILYNVNNLCPLIDIMYATFGNAVHSAERVIDDEL